MRYLLTIAAVLIQTLVCFGKEARHDKVSTLSSVIAFDDDNKPFSDNIEPVMTGVGTLKVRPQRLLGGALFTDYDADLSFPCPADYNIVSPAHRGVGIGILLIFPNHYFW